MNFKKRVNGSWTDTPHYIHNTSTDTITTLPAKIYPNAATATVGMKGNTVQSTTPTPDNPVMPQGTGERTGNLWNEDYTEISGNLKYVPIFVGDGTFTLSTDTPDYSRNAPLFLLSGNVTSGASTTTNGVYNGVSRTKESLNGYITIAFRRQSASTDPTTHKTMLNTGSQPLSYEQFGYKIPISSASTTTPIYLGEVQTERKIKKLVLDGTENWAGFQDAGTRCVARITLSETDAGINTIIGYCSHIEWKSSYASGDLNRLVYSSDRIMYLSLDSTLLSENSLTAFKAYLAAQYANGTPVCVWYVLATPTTGIVNEPLRKIGDYADTLSNVSIPVTAGGDTLSIGTTLQPSEVTVNYKGWHPVVDVHERSGGQWD